MQRVKFDYLLDDIFAIFGKTHPKDRIADAVFERVEHLPDEFMEYAKKRLQDVEKLPANLGGYLVNILLPDFKRAYPEKFLSAKRQACWRCDPDNPGLKRYYKPDGEPQHCACDCCTDERLRRLLGYWTDYELKQAGYLMEIPEVAWNNERTEKFRRAIFNADWSQRKAHIHCLQEMDA